MELDYDIGTIKNEDLLKKMWQQTEDLNRRKEIHSHLFKLRESRLRDLYNDSSSDIMSQNSGAGFGKDPLTPCHGDSLVDQSFQSLKSKEVRDSMSPTHNIKFHALSLNQPNNTGWDVQSSSEVSPDGRAFRSETVATTDGVEKINGGIAEFQGRNEQRSSASHEGDDKNFVKKASESSKTHLEEKVVIGDPNSGHTEMKTSSKTSSSSQVISSSSSTVYQDGNVFDDSQLTDDHSTTRNRLHMTPYEQQREQQRLLQQERHQQQQLKQHQEQLHSHHVDQSVSNRQSHVSEQYNQTEEKINTSSNLETERTHEENRRYVDMDKASPEYQKRVQYLMAQPGEIISNTVEYPKPNVKMITTVKRLPDGTIVRNKRYETEETQPSVESTRQRQLSNTNHTNTESRTERRVHNEDNIYSRLQKTRDTESTRHQPSTSHSPRGDHVDNVHATNRPAKGPTSPMSGFPAQIPESQTLEHYTDDVAKVATFSSVKKSSRRFSTETTSETIEEVDDRPGSTHYPDSPRHITSGHEPQAFTTHGFPSVRPNKPTQEYPTDRPQSREEYRAPNYRPSTDGAPIIQTPDSTGPSDRFPVVKPSAQMDGDVVVMSETRRSSKQKFNTERVTETEIVSDRDYAPGDHVHEPRPDFSTHGFPSVKESSPFRESSPGTFHPSSPRRPQSTDDFSTHGFPSVKSPQIPHDVHTSSPRRSQPGEDFSTHGFPSVRSPKNYSNGESSPRRSHPTEDFSTHGFPSVRSSLRSPSKDGPTTKEIPITVERQTPSSSTQRKPQGAAPTTSTTKRPSSTTESSTTTTTIRKEKEVDAAHRAFAASLRSSSPVDGSRRDSYSDHQRYTPRSSIASSKNTYRRDMREGSHDSTAPSEGSRISTGTVTRQSPGKVVGKTTVSKQTVVKTKNSHASNETIDMTPQRISKSPSPTKTITTTTVTKTSVDVPKSDNQINTPAANLLIPINEPLTITKSQYSANDAGFSGNLAVEEPCIKKHFYQLGPSDNSSSPISVEKTPYSPASSSTKPRTHPNNKTPDKDDLPEHKNEPDYESSTPSDIETSQQVHRNIVRKNTAQDDDYESPSPSDHIRPISKDTSDQNTYVRETTFELTDGDQPVFVDSNQTDFSTHTGGSPSKKFPGVPDTVNTEVNKTHDLFRQTNRTRKIQDQKNTKEIVNEFITKENDRQLPRDETPDGALNSKGREPFFLKENDEPTSPTFRKKGLSRRETFEDRCRQILGMEDSGDTQGVYKTTRDTDTNFEQTTEKMEKTPVPSEKNKDTETTEFLVRIEDCEDDDQNYISNVSHVKVDTDKLYKTTFKTNVNVDESYMEPRPNRTGKSPTDNDNIPKRDYDSEDSIEKEQIITRKETTKSSRSSVTDLSRTSSPDRTHSPTRPVSENTESEPTKKAPLSKRKPSPNRENITTSTTAIRTTTTGHIDTNEPETRKKLPSTTPTKKSVSQTVPNKPSPVKTRPGVTVNKVSPEKPDFERSTRKPSSEIGTPIDRKTSPTTRLITKKPGSRSAPEPERHRKSSSKPYTYKEPNTSQTLTPDRQDSPTRKTVTKITDISETDVNFEETQSTKQPSTTRKPSPVKQTPTSDSPRQEPEWSDTSRTSSPDRQCSPTRTIVIKTTDQSETDVCFEDTEYTKRTSTKYATVKQTPTRDSPNKSSPQQEPQVSDTSRTSSPDRQRSPTRKTVTKVTDIAETDVNFEYSRSTKRPFTTTPRKPSPVKQTPIRDSPLKKSPGEEPVSDTSRTSSPDRQRSPTRTTATKKTVISETDVCLEDTDYIKRSSTKSAPVKQTPTKDSPQKSSSRQGPEVSDTSRTSSPDRQRSPTRKTVTKVTDIAETDVNFEYTRSTKRPFTTSPRKPSPVKQTPIRDSPLKKSPGEEPVSDTSRTSSPDRHRSPTRTTATKKTDISETDVCLEDTDYIKRSSTKSAPVKQTPTKDSPQKSSPRQGPEVSDTTRTSSPDRQLSPNRKTVTKITDISNTDVNYEKNRSTKSPSRNPRKQSPVKQTPTRDSPHETSPRQEPQVSDTSRTSSPDRQRSPNRTTVTKKTDISETDVCFEDTDYTTRTSTIYVPERQTPTRDYPQKTFPRQEPEVSDASRTSSPDRQRSPTRKTVTKITDISETDINFEDTRTTKHPSTTGPHKQCPLKQTPTRDSPRQEPEVSDTIRTSSPDRQRSPTRSTMTKTTDISETRNFEETRSTKRPSTTNSGKPSPVTQTPTRDSPHKSSPRQEPMSDTLRTPSPDRQQSPTRSTFTKQTDISETDVCFEDTEYIKHSSTKSPTRDSPQKSSPRQQPKVSDTSRTSSPDRQRSPTRITVTKKTDLSETDVCFEDTEYTKRTSTKYIPVKQTPARDSPQESSPRQQPDVSDTSRTSSPDRQRSPTRTTVTKVTDISETDIKYQKARSTKRPSTTSPRKPSPVKQTPTKDSPHKSSPREEPEVSDTSRTSSPDRQDSPTRRTVTKTIAVSASDDCFEETKSTKRSSITSPRKTSPVKQVPLKPSAYPTPSNDKPIRKPMTKLQSEPKSYTDTVNKTKESKVYTSVTNNTRKTPSQILDQPRSVRPTTRVQQQVTTSKKERFENDRSTIPTTPRKPSKEPSKTPRKETPSTERLQTSPNARSPRKEKPRTNDDESPRTSPDVSPTRCTERRRSSNISVHTEIIIDHSRQRSPQNESPRKIDKTDEDLISKSLLQRQNKKLSVTERKESAPVHRVTRKDKDVKMSRSTSENVFKTTTPRAEKKPTPSSLSPNVSPKPDRRPNKCLTTKSINLTTMDRIINSEDMESVIIDIQHAKSSREPSPDKIIPTPVPIDVDTGKPRYPDVVQEPEDEPRRKPVVKNIPIFEEDSNDFVGCQIMEVKVSKVPDNVDNTEILDSPTIEAPKSLDYPSLEPTDDVCLLSVHEKVSKFTQNAEDTKKPKTSGTFFRDVDQTQRVHEDDVCLLTVDQKVNKFLQTAENITNESFISSKDVKVPGSVGKLPTADRLTPTPEKLAASAPQRSPELVAKIERQISRQPEFEPEPPKSRVPESTPKYTVDVELSPDRQQPQRTSTTKSVFQKEHKYEEDVHEVERVDKYTPRTIHDDIEVDELVPMTKNHTTAIELKRQKDILSRPSVFKPKGDTSPVESHPKPSSPKSHRYTERDAEVTTDVCATKNTKSQLQTSINTNVSEVKRKFEPSNRTELPVARPNQKNEPEESESEPEDQPRKRYPYDDEQSPQKISPTHEPEGSDYEHEVTLESFRQTEEHVERDVLNRKFSDGKRPVGGKQYAPDQNTLEPEDVTTEEYRRSQTKQTRKDISSHRTPVSPIKKAPVEKPTKQPQLVSHSPTRSPHYSTKSSTTKITERTVHHIPNNQRASSQEPEQILISPIQKKPQSTTPGRSHVLTESVAARRNIFEKGVNANTPTSKPHQARPGSITPQGRRPSYMDHTKSSLEHTRRDSLEINKTNYSRKTSFEDEIQYDRKPNAAVQFDIPRNPNYPKDSTVDTDELNIEEIFELHILEKLLETVTSYEIRRRIRAQIRLVKKNMQNLVSSTKVVHQVDSKAHTTKRTQVSHHDERDDTEVKTHRQRTKSGDRSVSPSHPRVSSASPVDVHADKVITKKYSSEEISIEDRQHPHRPGRSGSPSASRGTTSIHRETHVTTKDRSSRHHDELQEKERIVSTSRDRSKSPLYPMGTCGTSPVTRRPSAPRDPKQVNVTDFSSEEFSDHTSSVERKTSSIYRETQSSSQHYDEEHEIESHRSRSRSPTYPSGSSPSSTSRRPAPQISQKTRPDRSSSPEGKTSKTQRGTFMATKTTTTRSGQTLTQQSGGSMPKDQGRSPIWADRKNVLKNPTRSPTKTPTASTTRMTSSAKTSSTSRRKNLEEDCIISSYGIGPTDENGLPLFGIKALKKKPQSQPSDTTQEVTGYVVEEQYYSDNRTKPIVKRKELVYSTNPEELDAIQRQLHREISPDASAAKQIDTKYIRGDDFMSHCPEICTGSTTSTKYVRRGSVKEMSEKFIRKESSQSMTDKTSKYSYPKAGLILRTNSRSGGVDDSDTLEVRTKGDRRDFDLPSSEDDDHCTGEYMSEMRTSHMTTEGESESESVNIRKEIRSQKSTRSFLNSSKESRVVTGVDDVLERMRNADNVVEEGDTQEDQEARALLNKFLGASVIMSGVETVLPTKQSKINTTNGSNNNNKQQVKTTRVTQTIKSGTSSSPVARKTCDIEEIWDEEILKKLLEQATSYEERRKIRARLRQLMAEREECKNLVAGVKAELPVPSPDVKATESDASSESEYEEIIEEVTDYSDADADPEPLAEVKKDPETKTPQKVTETNEVVLENETKKVSEKIETKEFESKLPQQSLEEEEPKQTTNPDSVESFSSSADKPAVDSTKSSSEEVEQQVEEVEVKVQLQLDSETEVKETATETTKSEGKSRSSDETLEAPKSVSVDSVEEGESLIPLLQDLLHQNMPQADKTSTQNSKLKTSNKTTTNPRTSKTVESHGSESSSNLSVSQYNNHNNSSNTNNTNTKKTPNTDSTGQTTTSVGNSSSQGFDQLNVPPREDSGTESGEDLRLIAAGIRDKLHMQSDTNLIQEVTTALNRLESSLKEGKDLSLDEKKRNALLALVARLQTGLTSPEKLADTLMSATAEAANANANEVNYEETSSPEADAHRSNRQRFAKRRNRNSRHTVGVSREELEDARRYMEDVLMMGNISNSTTPDSSVAPVTPPNWFPLEKNASSGAILTSQPLNLYRPNQFVPSNLKSSTENLKADPTLSSKESPIRKDSTKRPLSGDYSVSFVQANATAERSAYGGSGYNPPPKEMALQPAPIFPNQSSGDSSFKSNRFSNKKVLMKRANTIDIPKTKNYNPEFETDSEVEDKGPTLGLKRAVQVSVKQRVRNVVPPFEPKTENDHKFLAFINKQSPKHGLGWNSSKSVSNWTNKFGSIKHTFEVGAAATVTTGKPPQVPGHTPQNAAKNYWNKNASQQQAYDEAMAANAQLQRSQQEATERRRRLQRERMERDRLEREHMERMRAEQLRKERIERERLEREYYEREKMEKERLERERYEMERFERERFERERFERERYERDRMDRERMERDRLERERLERERLERQIMERDRLERDRLERERMEKERLEREILARERSRAVQYSSTPDISLSGHPSPIVNKFIHAPQSVFRPIDGNGSLKQNVFKPINGSNSKPNTWQPPESAYHPLKSNVVSESPQYLTAKSSVSNSSSPIATSPIGLPWVSKSADKSALRSKASKFEDKSPYDQRNSQNLHRHNSLRSNNANQQQLEQARKRPSLPNTADPYLLSNAYQPNSSYFASAAFPPAPTNISFTYADYTPATNYQSYPCLPSAVTSMDRTPQCREDSLTNPQAEPLVLSSAKPLYTPQTESLQAPPPSNYQRQFDYASPLDSTPTSPSFMSMPPTDCTDDDLDSDSNIMEYRVESKVMGKPQSQTAVRVGRRTNHVSDDEVYGKNSRQARNLLHTMKNLGSNNGEQKIIARGMPTKPPSPKVCISPDGRSYQAPIVEPLFPQITNFEPNRSPMYVGMNSPKSTSMQSLPTQYQQNPTYIPPTIDPSPYQQPPMTRSNPEKLMYQQQAPTTGQMNQQRNRNISENSTSSKLSNNSHPAYVNTVTTGSSWDGNAMYADEMRREMPLRTQSNMDPMPSQYHTQQMSQGQPIEQHQQQPVMSKPELRPKPQLAPLNVRQASVASQPPTQVAPNYQQQTQSSPLQPMEKTKEVLNPSGMSSKPTDTTFRRQNTIDSGVFESRRNSQQSQQTQEQQQQQQQLAVEMRRKSLGNAVEIQQQNRKSTAFETQCEYTQRSKQQEYKSSAPPDTPDIVKSSLPKDENVPILKKFGPPQRHHYIPNAYQSPTQSQTQTHTKRIESSTKVKATSQKVIQHSSVVSKPTIVETPATPQLQSESTEDLIPRNIVFNNVSAFTSMSRRSDMDHSHLDHDHRTPNKLSKSDSWSQIVQQQSQYQQSISSAPKFNSGAGGNELRRTKSGHSLAVPKMFEAGIDKSQVTEKQRTVAAYFSGNKSPNAAARQGEDDESKVVTRKSAINRTKTTQKVSTSRKSLSSLSAINGAVTGGGGGLARSATMPHIANVSLLDESNVEDAFEQLMMEHCTTTEKSEVKNSDGAVVTTTTKVTTRTVSQAPKPVSPFAKFKQLDKQNSLQSPKSPSTPTTPGGSASGSAPIFKFTDPALNARAATVKDQLLQWCQIKTKEYENVQITNFSTSWSDGLAFCALIHHFLPDAFDYSKLTPQTRKHNFELAFTVADEKAGIAPLLDVEDMVVMKRPDWKCVFVYVQSIYRRFRNCQ